MIFERDRSFRDIYQNLDVEVRTGDVADDGLQNIRFEDQELLYCFFMAIALLIDCLAIGLIKKSLPDHQIGRLLHGACLDLLGKDHEG